MKLVFEETPVSEEVVKELREKMQKSRDEQKAREYIESENLLQTFIDHSVKRLKEFRRAGGEISDALKELRDNPPKNIGEAVERMKKSKYWSGQYGHSLNHVRIPE